MKFLLAALAFVIFIYLAYKVHYNMRVKKHDAEFDEMSIRLEEKVCRDELFRQIDAMISMDSISPERQMELEEITGKKFSNPFEEHEKCLARIKKIM